MPEFLRAWPAGISRAALLVAALVLGLAASAPSAQAQSGRGQSGFLRAVPPSAESLPDDNSAATGGGEAHAARRTIELTDFYDPANPDYGTLQRHNDATRNLPRDPVGFPDWMRALSQGAIGPRSDLSGKGKMEVLDLDVIMRNTKEMPNVRFPHRSHTLWLACSNCHPAPFAPIAGGNQIRMADIFRGQFCGMCHDRVAFVTFYSCARCHSVPQGSNARN